MGWLVNLSLDRKKEMELITSYSPKKVMIVGGDPGGLIIGIFRLTFMLFLLCSIKLIS